ncbi:Os01g0636600, partial [Oryza sativa Japonica Group]
SRAGALPRAGRGKKIGDSPSPPPPWPLAFTSASAPASAGLPLSRTGSVAPLRHGFGSAVVTAPPAEDEDFATAADLQFEPPLKVVKYPDPILRARNKRINTFDDNLRSLTDEMFDVMYKTDGIGLSAPQVGVNVQLMVFNPAGVKGEGEEIVLVNPVVYKMSKRLLVYEESCLSFPGIYANVVVRILCVQAILLFDDY